MVDWLDFGIGLLTDIIGAVIISVPIYILFTRRERQKERTLQKNVLLRIQDSFKSFKVTIIYDLRNDVSVPLGYVALLSGAPVASLITDMEKLEEEFSNKVKSKDYDALLALRDKQWQLILSDDFLPCMKIVIGQWSKKQWQSYLDSLIELSKQIKELMDAYQSRLPPETVCIAMDFEKRTNAFPNYLNIVPEFFQKIDEMTFEPSNKFITDRHGFHIVACEELHSTFKALTKLFKNLEEQNQKKYWI